MKVIEEIIRQNDVKVSNFESNDGSVNQKVSFKAEMAGLMTTISSYDGLIDENYNGPVEVEGNFTTNAYKGKVYGALEVKQIFHLQRSS